ncbi:MAG: sugar phosphate isomerase/epimerase [Thaumarchaeota archaeon]|nr:sugar phosphate isomerase/epimerase [Nitrososphaerota archaeon]
MKLNCGSRIIEQLFSGPAVSGQSVDAWRSRREPDLKFTLNWIRRVSELGVNSLCLWIPSESNLRMVSQKENAERIRLSCEERSMTIDNLAVSFLAPWTIDKTSVGRVENAWSLVSGFADVVGAEVLEILSPSVPLQPRPGRMGRKVPQFSSPAPGFSWDRVWKRYVSRMRQYARLAESHDLLLAVEPRPMDLLGNTDSLLRLMDGVPSENLGGVVDFSHMQMSKEIPALSMKKLGKKIFSVHLSDDDGITDCHWPPGQGIIEWPPIFRALRESGYDGILSLDVSGMDVEQEVIEAREYVQDLLRRLH